MAGDFNRERSLLRFADESEDAAAGLNRYRESLPRNATRITAIISELFAISSVLRQIHNEEGTRHYGPSFYRINDDLQLVFSTLEITLADIFDMFGRRDRPDQMVWEDLNHRMENEEGFDLLERLEWYRDFLDTQFEVLGGRDVESPRELRRDLRELFEAQSAASRRQRRRSVSGATTPVPRIRITPAGTRPQLPRMVTPISPTVMSDEWDNYTFVDGRPPVLAPEPPLSPTFTSSSSHTMSSSQTSYSSDPRNGGSPPILLHWAQQVFDGSNPATRYKAGVQLDDRSSCHGSVEPDALQNLVRDGFQRALQLSFDQDRLYVRLYWRPIDHRARILVMTKDRYGQPLHYCTPLTNLKIIRNGSCLQLCRARQDGRYSLWARLNFLFHERMVLFYSTFVAMKRQDERGVTHRDLVDDFELEEPDTGEQELFAGQMKHGNMYHALRLFLDRGSGVVRLEACPLRGPRKNVPIWTAFVTKYAYDPDWAQFERRGVVSFAAIRPPPSVFVAQYEPPMRGGNYILPFTTDEDALMFMETWAQLCRTHGRHV